ncbi:MAG: hypothetical protein ACLQSR_16315 [Limisphaerales bacterium]
MKCPLHNAEAIGICAYCGRGLCGQCSRPSDPRLTCSEACAAALNHNDQAVELILKKSVQNANASSLYSYLCAGVSAAGAFGAWYCSLPTFIVWFTGGCSVVLAFAGYWYGRGARKQS